MFTDFYINIQPPEENECCTVCGRPWEDKWLSFRFIAGEPICRICYLWQAHIETMHELKELSNVRPR
jgi:hypothetical protein